MRKQKTFVSCSPFRLASQSLSGAKEFDIYFYLNFLNNGRIKYVHRHRRESPALLWAGRGLVPTPARSLSVHFVQRGSVSNGALWSPARSSLVHRVGDPRVCLAAAERHTLTMRYGRGHVPTPGPIGRR